MHGPTCIFWANLTHFSLEAAPVDAARGSYLQHSCWTYWGHSGAPLFDERGEVRGSSRRYHSSPPRTAWVENCYQMFRRTSDSNSLLKMFAEKISSCPNSTDPVRWWGCTARGTTKRGCGTARRGAHRHSSPPHVRSHGASLVPYRDSTFHEDTAVQNDGVALGQARPEAAAPAVGGGAGVGGPRGAWQASGAGAGPGGS